MLIFVESGVVVVVVVVSGVVVVVVVVVDGVVVVVESVVVLSVFALSSHAVKEAAITRATNSFFMIFAFSILKIIKPLYRTGLKGNPAA